MSDETSDRESFYAAANKAGLTLAQAELIYDHAAHVLKRADIEVVEPPLPTGIAELARAAESARLRYEMLSMQPAAFDPDERAMQMAHYEMALQQFSHAQERLRDACAAAVRKG